MFSNNCEYVGCGGGAASGGAAPARENSNPGDDDQGRQPNVIMSKYIVIERDMFATLAAMKLRR